VHNSRYVKRLIYDSIDWIDDNVMNNSSAIPLTAVWRCPYAFDGAQGESYLLYGARIHPENVVTRPVKGGLTYYGRTLKMRKWILLGSSFLLCCGWCATLKETKPIYLNKEYEKMIAAASTRTTWERTTASRPATSRHAAARLRPVHHGAQLSRDRACHREL